MFLCPIALAYLAKTGAASFTLASTRLDWLLVASGPVTTIPLLCFAAAARRLRMTTLGFLQFLTPSLQICLALFLFGEPFTASTAGAFR